MKNANQANTKSPTPTNNQQDFYTPEEADSDADALAILSLLVIIVAGIVYYINN